MKKILLLILLLICQVNSFSQQDAWIYLTDKENVAEAISNPITILTQKSIDRKFAHNVIIDERDVPVNESYIAELKLQQGITVMAKSKWFNAIHVRGTQTNIEALTGLPFVSDIDFADKSLNTTRSIVHQNKFELENVSIDFNYGNIVIETDWPAKTEKKIQAS